MILSENYHNNIDENIRSVLKFSSEISQATPEALAKNIAKLETEQQRLLQDVIKTTKTVLSGQTSTSASLKERIKAYFSPLLQSLGIISISKEPSFAFLNDHSLLEKIRNLRVALFPTKLLEDTENLVEELDDLLVEVRQIRNDSKKCTPVSLAQKIQTFIRSCFSSKCPTSSLTKEALSLQEFKQLPLTAHVVPPFAHDDPSSSALSKIGYTIERTIQDQLITPAPQAKTASRLQPSLSYIDLLKQTLTELTTTSSPASSAMMQKSLQTFIDILERCPEDLIRGFETTKESAYRLQKVLRDGLGSDIKTHIFLTHNITALINQIEQQASDWIELIPLDSSPNENNHDIPTQFFFKSLELAYRDRTQMTPYRTGLMQSLTEVSPDLLEKWSSSYETMIKARLKTAGEAFK